MHTRRPDTFDRPPTTYTFTQYSCVCVAENLLKAVVIYYEAHRPPLPGVNSGTGTEATKAADDTLVIHVIGSANGTL